MMTGFGQFGPMEMGGMFTVVKVREGLDPSDYKDPGWYRHPDGTIAYEWQGDHPSAVRAPAEEQSHPGVDDIELKAVKPDGKAGHRH
jgi:hypothetical protein